jgi:PST family polysaccharide transporter
MTRALTMPSPEQRSPGKPEAPPRRTVLINTAWMMADKIIRLGVGLVVWVWLARHFGPATFGAWNYAIAFVALFGAVAALGLDGVVVRELVREGSDAGAVLGTALGLRIGAGGISGTVALLAAVSLRSDDWLPVALVAFNAAVLVFQSSQVLDFHFQARMRAQPAVVAVNVAFLVTTVFRLLLLVLDAPIEWFGASLVLEAAVSAALLWRAYCADARGKIDWRFSAPLARRLIGESWPLALSSLAVMAYMRLDQVMLAQMLGDAAVGQFSAALRIAEVWYFIPMAIVTAAFPVMLQKKAEGEEAYRRFVQSLYDVMAWLGLAIAVVTSLCAPWLIHKLYGSAYGQSSAILAIQIWAGITVSMSFVHGKWLLAEGLQRYGLGYTVLGAVVNITLNLVLIPRFGATGAAWATLATQVGLLPIQLLLPKARSNFFLMIGAVRAPLRVFAR